MTIDQPKRIAPKLKIPDYLSHLTNTVAAKSDPKFLTLHVTSRPETKTPIPMHLQTKNNFIEILPGNLLCQYQGPGKADSDAAAVRTDNPIPVSAGIYYFEVKIISKGRDGYISIGFQAASVPLSRLPGWEPLSWGYHGDDGYSFAGSGTGKQYGPTFTTGDVVGCIINFINSTATYTKNGMILGPAFQNIATNIPLYPAIGLRTPGEICEANFGQSPFRFDIYQHCIDEKSKAFNSVLEQPLTTSQMNQILVEYLIQSGYQQTAHEMYQKTAQSKEFGDLMSSNTLFSRSSILFLR
jgi:hypothetical protein